MDFARFIAARFGPSLRSPCRLTRTTPAGDQIRITPDELGRLGEDIARRWLRHHGLKILHRNYRARHGGEVDLVCRDAETLVFIEVKTRSTRDFGNPADAVDRTKQRLVVRGAHDWLRRLGQPDIHYRFDIVEVIARDGEPPGVNHLRNAFHSADEYYY